MTNQHFDHASDRLKRIMEVKPALQSMQDAASLIIGSLTPAERKAVRTLFIFGDLIDQSPQTPPNGELAPSEQKLIAWTRRLSKTDQEALSTALVFISDALNLWGEGV